MKGEGLKGHLDLLLLAALGECPAHGYAIAETLRARSAGAFDLPEGTIYPALHRLEEAGLLASQWSEQNSRRRRVYELTSKGIEALAKRQREWRAFAHAVQGVLASS